MGQTGTGETILLVDDDALSRDVLAAVLAGEGYIVVAVSSGEEAVSRLAATAVPSGPKITAVLTDLQMPGLAGIDLAHALRSVDGPPVPLLLMSASRPPSQITAAFDGFLGKPLAITEIPEALRSARTVLSRAPGESSTANDGNVLRSPVLDEATFVQIAAAMPPERLTELFRMCFTEADRHIRDLELFAAAGDDQSFRQTAHRLKGSFGITGARELADLAAAMEVDGADSSASRSAERAGAEPGTVNSTTKVTSVANFRAALDRLRGMLRSRGVEV